MNIRALEDTRPETTEFIFRKKKHRIYHGQKVKCRIHGCKAPDAVISIYPDKMTYRDETKHIETRNIQVYICQDEVSGNGDFNPDRFGYQHSWAMDDNVTHFKPQ